MCKKVLIISLLLGVINCLQANNIAHKSEAYLHMAKHYKGIDNKLALIYIDSGAISINKTPNTKLLFKTLFFKSLIYHELDSFVQAYTIGKQIKPYYLKTENNEVLTQLHFIFGEYHLQNKQYHESLDNYLQSNIYNDSLHDIPQQIKTKSKIAVNLLHLNQYESAEHLLIEVKSYAQQNNDDQLMLHSLHYLAHIYEDDLTKSIGFYKRAINLSKGNPRADLQIELARQYLKDKAIDSSILYVYKSLSNIAIKNATKANAYLTLAQIYERSNQLDSSLYYLDLVNNTYKPYLANSQHRRMYLTLSKLQEKKHNYHKAYKNLLKAYHIKDSLNLLVSGENFKALEESYYNKQKVKNVELLSTENALQKEKLREVQWNNLLLSSLSFALILLIVVSFYFSRKYRKLYKTINNKNKQINQKNIALSNTITTRDRLISVIAHDIKNPLGTISGFAELIGMNEGSVDKMKKYANLIHHSAINLQDLLDNLLSWARSQKENISISPTQLNTYKLVDDTITLLEPIANEGHVLLKNQCKIHHNIHADSNTVKTIIRNITSNAIKFSPANSSILISSEDDGKHVIIKIQDSGIGIQEEDIPKLFMQDIDRESIGDHHKKGTGVGLLLCKEFIDLNDGQINVKSEIGKGSVFTLHFPKSTLEKN